MTNADESIGQRHLHRWTRLYCSKREGSARRRRTGNRTAGIGDHEQGSLRRHHGCGRVRVLCIAWFESRSDHGQPWFESPRPRSREFCSVRTVPPEPRDHEGPLVDVEVSNLIADSASRDRGLRRYRFDSDGNPTWISDDMEASAG